MTRSTRRSRIVRSGVIGFAAGLATLGVAASASPVHSAVATAVGVERAGWSELLGRSAAADAPGREPAATSAPAQGQWLLPQEPAQPQPNVQPQPQQAPQSRAS